MPVTERTPPVPLTPDLPVDRLFPTLTAEQMTRIAAHGSVRVFQRGEVLVEAGNQQVPFFVVTAGELQIVRPSRTGETLLAVQGPGKFTGEVNTLAGRPALVRMRATQPGEAIALDRAQLLSLVQTDSEISDIVMRAFLLRRVELVAHGMGDVMVVGSSHCGGTLRVREFLTRNGHPHAYIDLDHDSAAQELLDQFHVGVADVPVLICRGEVVLRH